MGEGPWGIGVRSESNFLTIFFPFSKLLVVVSGQVSVEKLVSVEDAPSARFDCYGTKINLPTCLWLQV